MKIYKFDNHNGDIGVITANNYDEAVMVYERTYKRKVSETQAEYNTGGCYLIELGPIKENSVYTVCNQ